MLTPTHYSVSTQLISQALNNIPIDTFRFSINKPTGDFFYDPWVLSDDFVDTVWAELYNSIDVPDKGEARIIKLNGGESYISHADIDDRYHLNLSGEKCYLINLNDESMHSLQCDGIWYTMDANPKHTACNFGNKIRYQLVIRKLLNKVLLEDPATVTLVTEIDKDDARYLFDNTLSGMLNYANKHKLISDFKLLNNGVSFSIERSIYQELLNILPKEFKIV
jgi:hypothetical protein